MPSCKECNFVQKIDGDNYSAYYCKKFDSITTGYARINDEDVDDPNKPIWCRKVYYEHND